MSEEYPPFPNLLIVALLIALSYFLRSPEWRMTGLRSVTAQSSRAWDIAEQYCPPRMDLRDYCDRVQEINGHICAGEVVIVPMYERGYKNGGVNAR